MVCPDCGRDEVKVKYFGFRSKDSDPAECNYCSWSGTKLGAIQELNNKKSKVEALKNSGSEFID